MTFDDSVYAAIREGSRSSARVVVPRILQAHASRRGVDQPETGLQVLDVGCGEGWWSAEFAAQESVARVQSFDSATPPTTAPGVVVHEIDLNQSWATTPGIFDVVLCLEVAEHVEPRAGDSLVRGLCDAASPSGVVAFSAAIPGQGGHRHVNEQWPSYWDERFRSHGWRLSDVFRDSLWEDDRVEPWYRQNLLLAVANWAGDSPRALVHPEIWAWRMDEIGRPIR